MANKRANGEGSIVKRMRNGKQVGWRASITIGYNDNGKPIRKEFEGKTQSDVKNKLEQYKKEMLLGTISSDDKITVSEWFYTWLYDHRIQDLKPKSFEKYEGIYRNYIKDSELGKVKLKDLRVTHIQRYYNKLQKVDNKPPSTIKGINTRLKPCLGEAEKQGYIQKNYCKMVTLPKDNNTKTIKVLSKEEQQRFIEAIKGHKLEMLFLVALGTGLRLGELLGLKWSDIDFNTGMLTVNRTLSRSKNPVTGVYEILEQTPKTKNSNRTIPIPNDILNKLKEHKKNQNKQRLFI